jgi:hypothetical protein
MWFNRRERKRAIKESSQAVLDAEKAKKRVADRTPEVREVSGALRTIRERNHFAEQLRVIMEGGR